MKDNEKNKQLFNQTVYPQWKRIDLPDNLFLEENKDIMSTIQSQNPLVKIKAITDWAKDTVEVTQYGSYFDMEYTSQHTLGDKFSSYIHCAVNDGYFIRSDQGGTETPTIQIDYDFSELGDTQVENNLIIVEEGAKLDIVFDYHGSSARHYGTTRVIAKPHSQVKIIKLQRLDEQSDFYDQNFAIVEEGAQITWYDLQIGTKLKAISYETTLQGRHAHAALKSIYFGENKDQIDISYTMKHYGAQSESIILSKGALDGEAKKVFRGNLEFMKGAKQAVGKEEEFVVLLNKSVKSDSIPALKCSEDDVIGEHAASVGQVDLDKLFYLMSRGFSDTEAKKLIIKGSFEDILMDLPYDAIKTLVAVEIDRRL